MNNFIILINAYTSYDIVIGPIADDNLYQVLVSYENGVKEFIVSL